MSQENKHKKTDIDLEMIYVRLAVTVVSCIAFIFAFFYSLMIIIKCIAHLYEYLYKFLFLFFYFLFGFHLCWHVSRHNNIIYCIKLLPFLIRSWNMGEKKIRKEINLCIFVNKMTNKR